MDGKALDVDVLSRRVLGEASLHDGRVLTGIDGVVRLDGDTTDLNAFLPVPAPGQANSSLLRALQRDDAA